MDKNKVKYRIEHLDSYDGQDNYELGMYVNNEIVGIIQYTTFDGEITISDMLVRPELRRKGYASRMVKYMKDEHPEYTYKPSMKTDLGSKFNHKDVKPHDLDESIGTRLKTKELIKNLLDEAIKSGHWVKDSYPSRIETSTLNDMDPKHRAEIDKRLSFIEGLEFSNGQPQKIGIWIYKTPTPVLHEPFQPRDKGALLLAIVNNNNMTTLYWKHILEGQYDYDITFDDLVKFSNTEYYDAKTNPISIANLQKWKKSTRVPKNIEPRTDKFKKLKLSNGSVVRYYEILNKFETLDGKEISTDDIFDDLPEELQDKVLSSMDESVIDEEVIKNLNIEVYHGSPHEIETFSDEFSGGEDATMQNGPGIYLTTSYEDALSYSGNDGYVYKLRINPKVIYGTSESKRNIPMGTLKKLVMMASNWKENAQNFAENPVMGVREFLSSAYDYNDTDKDTLLQAWIDFYRRDEVEFVRNCVRVGIDGVVADSYNGNEKHYIIYNPSVIEIVEKKKL